MKWDFERGVLTFMGVLILGGMGFIFWQDAEAGSLQKKLGNAEKQLTQIGEIGSQVQDL